MSSLTDKQYEYWIPKDKFELVLWLSCHFAKPEGYFKKLRKKQLYAIYFKEREKMLLTINK